MITGCGKKLGPTSPDIWPPYVVESKVYTDHVDFRFNEPINTADESVILLDGEGDTVPVLDTVSVLQSNSVSIFPDTQYLHDTIFVVLKGITDSSMNQMKQYEKSFLFSGVKGAGSLYVSSVVLKRIRRKGLYLDLNFNMPVRKKDVEVFVFPTLYTDSNLHFLNPHEISIAVSDTPDFVLIPDNIRSFSGGKLKYPYFKRYAKRSFIKKKFNLNIHVAEDSVTDYVVFITQNSMDVVPVGRSAELDSILSDTCDLYIVSKNENSFLWQPTEIRGDSAITISNFEHRGIESFWNNIIDNLSK